MKTAICLMIFCFMFFSSCVRRPYVAPIVETPEYWLYASDERNVDLNIDWWSHFNDPVLNEMIKEAVQSNWDLQIATTRVEQFAARLAIVRSELFPQVFLDGTIFERETSVNAFSALGVTSRVFDFFSLLGSVSYEIDFWGRLQSQTDAAKAELLSQEEARKNVLLTIVTSTASSYFTLRQFDLQLQIAEMTVGSREESYELAKLRFEGGITSELPVKQAESELEDARVQLIRLKRLQAIEQDALSVLLGRYPQELPRGNKINKMPVPESVPAGLPSSLIFQRPDLRASELLIQAAHEEVNVARANFFPQISLTGIFGFESTELKNWFTNRSRTWQYGMGLLQPLFTGGRLTGELYLACTERKQAYEQYMQTILTAFQEVEDALVSYEIAKEAKQVERKRVAALEDYLYLAELQYLNGETDYLNVLDAQRNLFAARLDLVQAQADECLSLVGIYKSLGGGWVERADCLGGALILE